MNEQSYLFLLKKPSIESRKKANEYLKELGIRVSAQFGGVAVIGHGPSARIEEAGKSALFYGVYSKEIREIPVRRLTKDQKRVIDQWNFSFSPQYKKVREDKTHVGKKWNSRGMEAPRPCSDIDARYFKKELLKHLKITEAELIEKYKGKVKDFPKLKGKELLKFERELAENIGETAAYYLTRIAAKLSPEYVVAVRSLDIAFLRWLQVFLEHARPPTGYVELTDWKLENELSVGVIFVESAIAGGPTFTATERQTIQQEIIDGLTWLTNYEPKANISWVYDWQFTTINVANGTGSPPEDPVCSSMANNAAPRCLISTRTAVPTWWWLRTARPHVCL